MRKKTTAPTKDENTKTPSASQSCDGDGIPSNAEEQAKQFREAVDKLCSECHGSGTVCSGCGSSSFMCEGICNSNIKTAFTSEACPSCGESVSLGDEEVTVNTPELAQTDDEQDTQDAEPDNAPLRLDHTKATDSAEALARYDNETRLMVDAANDKVFDLQDQYENLKDETSQAKKAYEAADEDMRKMIRERRLNRGKPQQPHLFDGSLGTEREQQAEGLTDSPDMDRAPDEWKPTIASEPVKEPEDETWKRVPLSSLSLKPSILKKLESPIHKDRGPISPITTMGELTAYQEPTATGYCHRLIDIKGIGEAAAEEIAEACSEFWAARNAQKKVA